jgi:NAD(P)-dependent dehydrogenase (short-subunit alcohol dehydrogenase family)
VSDEAYGNSVLAKVKNIIDHQGLQALINNAATQIPGGAASLTRTGWQQTLNANLLAPFFWAQGLLADLETAKGSIVNISSIHPRLTKKIFVAYATRKAALSGLTRAMAVDLGPKVQVNAIESTAIETPMLKTGFAGKDALHAQLEQCHPAGRIGYQALKPVIGIHLLDFDLFEAPDQTHQAHWRFEMRDRQSPQTKLGDELQLHIIELPKAEGNVAGKVELLTLLLTKRFCPLTPDASSACKQQRQSN